MGYAECRNAGIVHHPADHMSALHERAQCPHEVIGFPDHAI